MHILHVLKTYYPDTFGGIEQTVRQLTRSISKENVRHTIFTLSRKASENAIIYDNETKIIRAQTQLELFSTPMSYSAFALFKGLLKDIDLIHYHFPWPFADLLHLICAAKKPAIMTYHSDIVRHNYLLAFYQPLMQKFLNNINTIVATSANYLKTSSVLTKFIEKVKVIPIGLDEKAYPLLSNEKINFWRNSIGEGFFLFIGVLRYYKGLHLLLEACVGTNYQVVIVGAGGIEEKLRKQATHLKLTNVHFIGAVSEEDKMALLRLCRAIVFPSHLRSEALGIALLEGSMHSKPLISSEIGTGSSYINIDGETGIVVAPGDPNALRHAMSYLVANPQIANKMGYNARKRFEHLFLATSMGKAYFNLYQQLVTSE